jgi:aspartate-semialdehyde dehydrogenase
VSLALARPASAADLEAAWKDFVPTDEIAALPSAPPQPVVFLPGPHRPQPRRDVSMHRGMSTLIGGVKPCRVLDWKFTALGHNTIRGAAGASVLNAEFAAARGLLD